MDGEWSTRQSTVECEKVSVERGTTYGVRGRSRYGPSKQRQDQETDGYRRKQGLVQALTNEYWRCLWLYDSWKAHLGWLRLV